MTKCRGCLKVRRVGLNKLPVKIAAPLARVLLPATLDVSAVIHEARSWLGVTTRHLGRDRHGVDCWGLPVVVLEGLGALPDGFDRHDYANTAHPLADFERHLSRYCTRLPAPVPGALISLNWGSRAHVAILTDTDSLIHAFDRAPHNAVIEHGFRGMWRERLLKGAWALPGVRYEPA